jgi:PASTA domain
MAGLITWYDILGILPGASTEEVRSACKARGRQVSPQMISGAPSKVIKAADRARAAAEEAWRVLGDPSSRERYEVEAGIRRKGSGLERPQPIPSGPEWDPLGWATVEADIALAVVADWLAPQPAPARRVVVPDIRGLFVGPCLRAVGDLGLHMDLIRLTEDPMPVEGLVVDQSPLPGAKVRRSSTLTVQVWHPPRR